MDANQFNVHKRKAGEKFYSWEELTCVVRNLNSEHWIDPEIGLYIDDVFISPDWYSVIEIEEESKILCSFDYDEKTVTIKDKTSGKINISFDEMNDILYHFVLVNEMD